MFESSACFMTTCKSNRVSIDFLRDTHTLKMHALMTWRARSPMKGHPREI